MAAKSGQKLVTKKADLKPVVSLVQPRILQRACDCGGAAGLTGKCETCASKRLSDQRGVTPNTSTMPVQRANAGGYRFQYLAIQPKARFRIQAKLTIGQPNDKYEQEADSLSETLRERVGDQVMRMPEPKVQRQGTPVPEEEEEEKVQTKSVANQITPFIQRQVEPEKRKEEALQTNKLSSSQTSTGSSGLQARITALKGGGHPLPLSERAFFEPRFGTDFSQVRIHADSRAAETSRAFNARAFTFGQDIVFGAGQYQPRSSEGQNLLAHELTHVIQQNRGGTSTPSPLHNSNLEREADQAASTFINSEGLIRVAHGSATGLACNSPRSLNQSLDPTLLSDEELHQEINLMRQWLRDNPGGGTEREQLLVAMQSFENVVRQRQRATQPSNSEEFEANISRPDMAPNLARLRQLENLLTQITSQTEENLRSRQQLRSLPPQSSEELDLQRLSIQDLVDQGRRALISLLEQRINLLNEEITSLHTRIGPNPSSSAEQPNPELEALGHDLIRRERERHQHQHQLRPLRRWQMRSDMRAIDAEIDELNRESFMLSSDLEDPNVQLLMARRAELEDQRNRLVRGLTSTATEYEQFDPRWGAIRYGPSPNCTNIRRAGCGPTSLAIVLNYLYQEDPENLAAHGHIEIVTPPETANYASTHGRVCNSGTAGDTMVTHVHYGWPGFQGQRISLDAATSQLRNGNLVIFLCVNCTGRNRRGGNKTYPGHFMVLNGVSVDGQTYNVLDPGAREATDIETISHTELQAHTNGFWIIERI